jgi:hypothetical protein
MVAEAMRGTSSGGRLRGVKTLLAVSKSSSTFSSETAFGATNNNLSLVHKTVVLVWLKLKPIPRLLTRPTNQATESQTCEKHFFDGFAHCIYITPITRPLYRGSNRAYRVMSCRDELPEPSWKTPTMNASPSGGMAQVRKK